ncbi:G patch domain-containing protein 8 [Paramyrothecium foliicola]|nr:G patch domain-containing protein 8 [Paramyrothecium foliicola]
MPPRHQTLPPAQTSSAREAQKSFYCSLCSKGYSRMNDYEAHLSSYDHSHKQRLKDMKAMVRDPNAGARARKAEAKADGIVSIKLAGQDAVSSSAAPGGFKKGGFKKSGFKSAFAPVDGQTPTAETGSAATSVAPKQEPKVQPLGRKSLLEESDTEDEGYEVYDPRFPTD